MEQSFSGWAWEVSDRSAAAGRTGESGLLYLGQKKWEMQAGSADFRPVPDCDPPVTDRRRRLLQMKDMIRRFSAIELENRKREPAREQLRLLARPLYRYETESDQILDGAVFCYVHTTDPEALVVLEAITNGDKTHWEYAFARRTTLPVMGLIDDKEVWSTKEVGHTGFNQIRYSE
jgi:hypothetical protein